MHFDLCLQIAAVLSAHRMRLECLLCLAYMAFEDEEWRRAQECFNQAYFEATECAE